MVSVLVKIAVLLLVGVDAALLKLVFDLEREEGEGWSM